MDLGLRQRTVLVAADDAEAEACAAVLRAEGATVLTSTLQAAGSHGASVDAVVAYLPLSPSSAVLSAGLSGLGEDWTMLEAVVSGFQSAIPGMKERGWGRLVTVLPGSVKSLDDEADERGAVVGLAVLGLHKAVVADAARYGITTNAVLRDGHTSPSEIADTVAFLLSDAAGYLQGVTVALDGARSSNVF